MTEQRLARLAEMRSDSPSVSAPYLALEHLEGRAGRLLDGITLKEREPSTSGQIGVREGDVLFSKFAASPAKSFVADRALLASTELICMRPADQVDSRWLGYLVRSRPFVEWAKTGSEGSTMPRTTWEKLRDYRTLVPPLSEQRAIADYLDTETARSGALIAKKQRMVELLKERQISTEAASVFRSGDCPTGIPTIPTISSRWRVLRNKVFMRQVNKPSLTGAEEMLSVSHLTGVTPRSEKTVYMFEAESTVGYKTVRSGDLVINSMWAWMGAAGVAQVPGIVSPAYGVYRIDPSVMIPEYFDIVVRTAAYIAEMTRFSRGITSSRLVLYPEEFLSLSSPVPPIEEQDRVVDRTFAMRAHTTGLVAKLVLQVDLFLEQRQALITAAVTGELAIPGVAE